MSTFKSGDRVEFTHYGKAHAGEVVGSDNGVVFIQDDNGRRRWKHTESLTLVSTRRAPAVHSEST